jgi:putative ATP-binding cassette transporter
VITYPNAVEAFSDEEMSQALSDAGLPQICGKLEKDDNWPMRLSGGEQQRIALARALLAKPDWIFLDEATASLDPDAEACLYQVLKERLPNTTLVSIAHRPSVAAFHETRLVFKREEGAIGTLGRVPEPVPGE